ncbi:MAG: hypothetical protein RL173_2636 [Fibrobacterota bacterium]|jgi:hypothetical protein
MMEQDEPDLPDAIEPKLVHMTWSPALRGMGIFLIMFLLGLIPTLFMTPGLISAMWLSIAGSNVVGTIVEVRDNRNPADDATRSGKYSSVVSTIEFQDLTKRHTFKWYGRMPASGITKYRWPLIGESVPVLVLEGSPSTARVDRFEDVWLPHGLLWPASMVFVLAGIALSYGQFRARRRGAELALRNQCKEVNNILVEKDDTYTDGRHFRYAAEFAVDGLTYISRSPTWKKRLNPISSGQILYLPEDPAVNWLVIKGEVSAQ